MLNNKERCKQIFYLHVSITVLELLFHNQVAASSELSLESDLS